MQTIIEVIPAERMRYPTVGDWYLTAHCGPMLSEENMVDSWKEADTLHIQVAKMSDPRHEDLVALHEYAEAIMCKHAGISPSQLDEFDKQWEKDHGDSDDEPGSDPSAPYHKSHILATAIENMVARELKVDFAEYDKALNEAWEKSGHGKR